MKIGLLSDTHGYLDPKIFDHFVNVDEIWHAGDLGADSVIGALEKFKPTKAVFGNIDSGKVFDRLPEDLLFTCESLKILMTHIGGSPPRYNSRVKTLIQQYTPGLFICGHSHIMKAQRDPQFNNMLYLNPGAAGHHGFHHIRTMVRFEIKSGQIKNMQVIELGKRGSII